MVDSRISGFYRKSIGQRIDMLVDRGLLNEETARALRDGSVLLSADKADKMIENVIGVFGLPLAVVPDFLLNAKAYVVPMVVEEPSVVAGVSAAAKLFGANGGFSATSAEPVLIGQIQLPDIESPDRLIEKLRRHEAEILKLVDRLQPNLASRGGGARALEYHKYSASGGRWDVVLHLLIDTRDAMGANIVNTICEGIAPTIESLAGITTGLKILSNLADHALVTASATLSLDQLHTNRSASEALRDAIVGANDFAMADPYRAATHNKGIMNGIDAVAIATGNDWRAIEAGAHAYAARAGKYRALTSWAVAPGGDLCGELCMPMKVGIVGGSLQSNPAAVAGLQIANTGSALELAELMVAVGLAQNFAAVKALVTEGIQKGHMRLHARSVAASVDAPAELFDQVVAGMIESGEIKQRKASELIQNLTSVAPAIEAGKETAADEHTGVAAGKVILLGEHAVVYDRHALALPLPNAVSARVSNADDGVHITIPDWHVDRKILPTAEADNGVAALVSLVMRRLGIRDQGFRIQIKTRIPAAMGLGSSASLVVAVLRGLNSFLSLSLDDEAINDIAFECEKLAHGNPSGIDNTLAVYGLPILYRRSAKPAYIPLALQEFPPLVIATGQTRGSTLDQVAGVRSRFEADKATFEGIFEQMDTLSQTGAAALQNGDYESLGSAMNVCQGLLNALGVSTVELETMIHVARSNGALGAKLTGAGGGGAIVALCPGATSKVAGALRSAGYSIVQTHLDSE